MEAVSCVSRDYVAVWAVRALPFVLAVGRAPQEVGIYVGQLYLPAPEVFSVCLRTWQAELPLQFFDEEWSVRK